MTINKRTLILYFSFSYSLKERLIVEPELGAAIAQRMEKNTVEGSCCFKSIKITQAKEQNKFSQNSPAGDGNPKI